MDRAANCYRATRPRWFEYGVVEHAYATSCPDDFAELVERYGHTAVQPARYTVSSFLARTLSDLGRTGSLLYRGGPATGRWSYNAGISWWALPPAPDEEQMVSWADTANDMTYVPGSTE